MGDIAMKLRRNVRPRLVCFAFAFVLALLFMVTSPWSRVGARSDQSPRDSKPATPAGDLPGRSSNQDRDRKKNGRKADTEPASEEILRHGAEVFDELTSDRSAEKIIPPISDLLSHSSQDLSATAPTHQREEEEQRGEDPGARMRFRLLSLKDENGNIPPDGLLRAKEHMNVMKAAQRQRDKSLSRSGVQPKTAGINPGKWASYGPGNAGGRIRSIVIDPGNPNNMWVGSVSGGIWHSADAGAHWNVVDDFMASLAVSSLIMDPTNSNVMYAGTGEFFSIGNPEGEDIASNGNRGLGVFKSTDGGVTWDQLATTNPADPTVCSPAGPGCPWSYVNRLAISSDGATILAATSAGIERSTDRGATWSQRMNLRMLDVKFNPSNSNFTAAAGYWKPHYPRAGGRCWGGRTSTGTGQPVRRRCSFAPVTAGD